MQDLTPLPHGPRHTNRCQRLWANLVQYDSESRLLGLQSRLRWTARPEAELFVVFNRGWVREGGAYRPEFDSGSVKFQYTWRL